MPIDPPARRLSRLRADEIEKVFRESDKAPEFVEEVMSELGRRKTTRARSILNFVMRAVGLNRGDAEAEDQKENPNAEQVRAGSQTPHSPFSPALSKGVVRETDTEDSSSSARNGAIPIANSLRDPASNETVLESLPSEVARSTTVLTLPELKHASAMTLGQLVTLKNASVRLRKRVAHTNLASITVAEALADMRQLEVQCYRIDGMGVTSVAELRRLLTNTFGALVDEEGSSHLPETFTNDLTTQLIRSLAKPFFDLTLGQICEILDIPVRLRNGLDKSPVRQQPLGELFLDWPQVRHDLIRQPNLGRRSIEDLGKICAELIASLLRTAFVPEDAAKAAADFIINRTPVSSELSTDLIGVLQGVANFKISDLTAPEIIPLNDLRVKLLARLEERPREVIERRYGIGRREPETLEQIGADHKVTRERIRQIEKKALGALSVTAKLLPIKECLVAFGHEAWIGLGGQKGYLSQKDIRNVKGLPNEFIFLSDVAGIDLEEWLDSYSTRWESGWCSKAIDIAELNAIASSIEDELKGKPLPRPCPRLGSLSEADLTAVVVELKLGKQPYGGYILEADRGTRLVRRVVELHNMFGSDARPLDAAELVHRLSENVNSPSISIRYISAIMSRYPHLFLEGDDAEWFGLGAKENSGGAIEFEFAPLSSFEGDDGEDTFTMAGFLKGILERTGPMKFTDIVTEAQKTLPSDRSIASVGPTMLMHREVFVRALPGVYGLHQAMPSEDELLLRPPTYLANEEQGRLFALGRRAGEPWGAFRLWTPAAEYALCSWAKRHAHSALFESLLTVASVEEWPVHDQEKAEWRQIIDDRGGKFHLHFEPRSEVGYALPKIDRLLAACLEAKAFGKFNWVVGNRILNRQADAHSSAGLVALMNALGALQFDPLSNWQMPQIRGPRLNEIVSRLEDELHNFGELNWQSPLGRQLMQEARERGATMGGWMNERLLLSMIDGAEVANPALSIEEDLSDLDKLLLEFGQANEAKMFDKMLDDLASSDDLSEAIS